MSGAAVVAADRERIVLEAVGVVVRADDLVVRRRRQGEGRRVVGGRVGRDGHVRVGDRRPGTTVIVPAGSVPSRR